MVQSSDLSLRLWLNILFSKLCCSKNLQKKKQFPKNRSNIAEFCTHQLKVEQHIDQWEIYHRLVFIRYFETSHTYADTTLCHCSSDGMFVYLVQVRVSSSQHGAHRIVFIIWIQTLRSLFGQPDLQVSRIITLGRSLSTISVWEQTAFLSVTLSCSN